MTPLSSPMTRTSRGIEKQLQNEDHVETPRSRESPLVSVPKQPTPAFHYVSNQQTTSVEAPFKMQSSSVLTRSEPAVKVATPTSSPIPMRRTSCADQFVNRQQQFHSNRLSSYPRTSSRQYYIRDHQEDLMANLRSLRDLMMK